MSGAGPHPELRSAPAHVFVSDLDHPDLDEDDSHHLTRVLRLRDGEAIGLSDGVGRWRLGHLRLGSGAVAAATGRRLAGVEPGGPITADQAPEPALSLAVALPKGDRGDWAVQKLTELGVDEIIVLETERSVLRWHGDRASSGRARLNRIIRQAAMQARLTRLPRLSGPVTVTQLVGAGGGPAWAAAEPEAARGPDLAHPRVLIGPEGGWAEGELPAGVARVGLGPTVLRTETAAVTAAGVLGLLRAGLLS